MDFQNIMFDAQALGGVVSWPTKVLKLEFDVF